MITGFIKILQCKGVDYNVPDILKKLLCIRSEEMQRCVVCKSDKNEILIPVDKIPQMVRENIIEDDNDIEILRSCDKICLKDYQKYIMRKVSSSFHHDICTYCEKSLLTQDSDCQKNLHLSEYSIPTCSPVAHN